MNYLIYKVSGGLNHMLNQINNCVHIAKMTQRILIIDCLGGGAFKNDFNNYFNIPDYKYETNYECIKNDLSVNEKLYLSHIQSSAKLRDVYYVDNEIAQFDYNNVVNSKKQVIYCSYIMRTPNIPWYIKVNKDVVEKISINKINDAYIGIHYRNTDMKHNLEYIIPKINDLYSQTKIIYLGTDDYTADVRLDTLLENKFNIVQYTKPYNNNGSNIHYGNPNKNEVIMNALTDMYHLTYATYFIPSRQSSFSKRILELRKNDMFFK